MRRCCRRSWAHTLAMLAGRAMRIIDPEVKNPGSELWERVQRLME